jgi:hypothetical protein
MDNINKTIRALQDAMLNILNATDLPIEVKRLVVADVYHEVVKQADTEFILMIEGEKNNAEST